MIQRSFLTILSRNLLSAMAQVMVQLLRTAQSFSHLHTQFLTIALQANILLSGLMHSSATQTEILSQIRSHSLTVSSQQKIQQLKAKLHGQFLRRQQDPVMLLKWKYSFQTARFPDSLQQALSSISTLLILSATLLQQVLLLTEILLQQTIPQRNLHSLMLTARVLQQLTVLQFSSSHTQFLRTARLANIPLSGLTHSSLMSTAETSLQW